VEWPAGHVDGRPAVHFLMSLISTVAKSLYSTVHHLVCFGNSKKIKPGSSWNVSKTFSIYFPNQEYECMYGKFEV
jgi:hypothetical protein